MVLHMRKIISILIALIMLMSAAPVFAEEVQQAEETLNEGVKSEQAAEQSTQQVQEQPGETEAGKSVEETEPPAAPEADQEEQKQSLEITLYDIDENKLEDKEKVQFSKGMTLEKIMELFNEEKHYEINWEKCTYIINDIKEENLDIKEYKPEEGDFIEIRMTEEAVYTAFEQE